MVATIYASESDGLPLSRAIPLESARSGCRKARAGGSESFHIFNLDLNGRAMSRERVKSLEVL
jgi:hypothetical protein